MAIPDMIEDESQTQYETIRIENAGQVGMLFVSIFCIVVPTIAVGLRFLVRRRAARQPAATYYYTASDWLLLPCLATLYGLSIANFLMVFQGGFTFEQATIPIRFGPDALQAFFICMAAWPIIWNLAVFTSKLSVLLMYGILMPVRPMIVASRCVAVFVGLFNLAGVVTALAICQPLSKSWDVTGKQPGHCGDTKLFYQWLSGINVLCDVLLFLLPLPVLYTLQLAARKKIALAAMLSVGFLTVIITIYRQALLTNMDLTNVTGTALLAFLFSNLEIAFAVTLACVPMLRPMFRGFFGRGGTGTGSGGGTGNGSHSTNGASVGKSLGGASTSSAGVRMMRRNTGQARGFSELEDGDGSSVQLQTYDVGGNVEAGTVGGTDRSGSTAVPGQGIHVETKWEVESHVIREESVP